MAGSVAITTYQSGKIVLVSWDGRQVSVLMRHFPKPMGIALDGTRLALASEYEVGLFTNSALLAPDYVEHQPGRYDALYLPRTTYFTGALNVHDIAFGDEGLWLVNTRFSCLSSVSDQFSFVPRWQPIYISELAPEDRCHLNGLAVFEGRPKFVTALGTTNEPGAWRKNKVNGGVLIDVETQEFILQGLCMPNSPRRYDGHWWLLNSGAGEFWQVDTARGQHATVCALPGYLRGLSFVGHYGELRIVARRYDNTGTSLGADGETTDEIALNPEHFGTRSIEDVLSTLVHEMVHLWQHHFGKPGRRRYHNKQWAEKMEAVGLGPTDTGKPGGNRTGESMTHFIIKDGAYAQVAAKLLTGGFEFSWVDRAGGTGRRKTKKKVFRVKYSCPKCGVNAWAKPEVKLVCGICKENLKAQVG